MRGEATAWWLLAGAGVLVGAWALTRSKAHAAGQYTVIEIAPLGESFVAMPPKRFANETAAAGAAQHTSAMGAVVLDPSGAPAWVFELGQSVEFEPAEVREKLREYGANI